MSETNIRKRKLYSILSVVLTVLIIICFCSIIFLVNEDNEIKAASNKYEITIDKLSTVSVYISGTGVSLKEVDNNVKVYYVEENTEITLRAVSESKIFESWNFLDSSNNQISISGVSLTSPIVKFTPTQDMRIKTIRRDATSSDYGKYIYDRFIISDANGLVYLQDIIEDGPTHPIVSTDLKKYNYFFENYNGYPHIGDDDGTTASDVDSKRLTFLNKKTSSNENVVFAWLQNGYFLVSSHLSIFSSNSSSSSDVYNFKGIGNRDYPFKGVFCGYNDNEISKLILVMSRVQETNMRFGLFGYLGEEAVVRNLNITSSIGITTNNKTTLTEIFCGGLAGEMENAIISNVTLKTHIGIEAKDVAIYAGGVAGKTTDVVFDGVNNFTYDGNQSEIIVNANTSQNIYVGMYSGYAVNTSVTYAKVDSSASFISVMNDKSGTYSNSNDSYNSYVGGLFGYFQVSKNVVIKNINFAGTKYERINSNINIGNNYVGGMIGYLTSSNSSTITIGKIARSNTDVIMSEITSSSYDLNSQANLYTAGIFAYIDSSNGLSVQADDDFKQGVVEKTIQDKKIYEYNYLFDGNYKIQSYQNGKANSNMNLNYGKAVSGGIVGKGLFAINGTDSLRSDIVFSSPNSNIIIESVQSSTSNHLDYASVNEKAVSYSDIEHAISAIYVALVTKEANPYEFKNINLYANNVTVNSLRETFSRSMGDIITGGFIGYSNDTKFTNINLYLNGGEIGANGLSYEIKNSSTDTNNLFCGGFIGRFEGTNSSNAKMNNVKITGLNYQTKTDIGTNVLISSIQNTIPGGGDYKGENYTGGLIGRMERVLSVENCSFDGSKEITDGILMQGQESPDSAFCGGLIGFIKNNSNNGGSEILISNCKISNTSVHGIATTKIYYSNPDIYVGGIIGAMYCHDNNPNTLTIKNCQVNSCQVTSTSNEMIQSYAAGIIGATTWAPSYINISDSYVYDSIITATENNSSSSSYFAWVSGICAANTNTKLTISNCGTIDSSLIAKSVNNAAVASAIANDYSDGLKVTGCYSNSSVYASGSTSTYYSIAKDADVSSCYYITNNLPSGYTANGTGVTLSAYEFTKKNIGNSMSVFYANDTFLAKHYPVLDSGKEGFANDGNKIKYNSGDNKSHSDKVNLWVKISSNSVSNGETPYDSYNTLEERHDAGWFDLGQIVVYYGSYSVPDTEVINDLSILYVDKDNNSYKYKEKVDGYNYLENLVNGQLIKTNYEEQALSGSEVVGSYSIVKNIIINLSEDLETLEIRFTTLSSILPLKLALLDESGNQISDIKLDNSSNGIGTIKLQQSIDGTNRNYVINYNPNYNISSSKVFYIAFEPSTTSSFVEKVIKITLNVDSNILVGAKLSDFTPPINYIDWINDSEIGKSAAKPLLVRANSTLMIYASIQKLHNLNNEVSTSAYNASYVSFSADNWTILSNGKLSSGDDGTLCSVTITLNSDTKQRYTLYFKAATEYAVNVSTEGATYDGVHTAGSGCAFKFVLNVYGGYSGNADTFNIKIGSTEYNLLTATTEVIKVFDENGQNIFYDNKYNWSLENKMYTVIIPKTYTNSNIDISAKFKLVYYITLNIQCDDFYPTATAPRQMVYGIEAGTIFKDYFGELVNGDYQLKEEFEISISAEGANTLYKTWIGKVAKKGIIFKNFYLISTANSVSTYGASFSDIALSDMQITSSLNFYASWSFLIELVEAPGTHIKTSFSDSFMIDITEDEHGGLVSRDIKIPINNNKGYIFTIEKDEFFVGDVGVYAYVIEGIDDFVTKDIEIQYFNDDKNIYYIPPELITGYLVITTSVSSSQVIVGENTASISEEIFPEDGIYTFKYIVNHQKGTETGNPSYIYNSGKADPSSNLKLIKDFRLEFKVQKFNNDTNNTYIESHNLFNGTSIQVYYQKHVDDVLTDTIVGSYLVTTSNINSIKLSEFKLLDENTNAFPVETFEQALSGGENITETYYFIITPPNGVSEYVHNEILNYIILSGYIDDSRESTYVEGVRTDEDFANTPIDGILSELIRDESSCHTKIYSVTPSRNTTLVEKSTDVYTFTDDKYFDIYDVKIENCVLDETYKVLRLYNNSTNGTITSSFIKFGINRLVLTLGYEIGEVLVYGSNDNYTWNLIDTVLVNSAEYADYRVDFKTPYTYFRIVNNSFEQICIKKLDVVSASNGMVYTKSFEDNNYNASQLIVGDTRHDGKSFLLAVQLKDSSSNIIDNIGKIATINIFNESSDVILTIYPLQVDVQGRNVLYFDLSSVLTILDVNTIDFKIIISDNSISISAIELYEVSSISKPAMGEVRYTFIK